MSLTTTHTWFITGGAGFIGSKLAAELISLGQKVIVYDNFSTGSTLNLKPLGKKVKIIEGDILDFEKLKKSLKGADYVLHHAALISVAQSVAEPVLTQKINIEGTNNVLEAARINGLKKVVFASSSAVYGNGKNMPYKEDGQTDCQSPYAVSKLIGEELLKMYYKVYGLQTVVLRYFNVFGPGQNPDSPYAAVIAKFIQCARDGNTFSIDWDGKQCRDFVFISDVVQANLLAVAKGKPGEVYNVASGRTYTLLQLASEVERLVGKKMKRVFKPKREGDVKKSSADISKIKKIGYNAHTDLKTGLASILLK